MALHCRPLTTSRRTPLGPDFGQTLFQITGNLYSQSVEGKSGRDGLVGEGEPTKVFGIMKFEQIIS